MRPRDVDDLNSFVRELELETDRGLPLVGAALIDDRLQETLRSFFCECRASGRLLDEGDAPLGTLSSRAQVCYALGLIDDFEFAEIDLIRKVRNEFAHAKHGVSFQNEKVAGLCSTLRSDLPEGAGHPTSDPRFRFTNAVVCLAVRLYYRPDWVAAERRQPKTWVSPEVARWRSVDQEKPPTDRPVLAMLKRR